MKHSTAIFEHPSYRSGFNSLVDVRDCMIEITSEELVKAANVVRNRVRVRGKAKEIIIVNDLISFGISREYLSQIDIDDVERKIFSSKDRFQIESVKSWLDLESTYCFPEFLNF